MVIKIQESQDMELHTQKKLARLRKVLYAGLKPGSSRTLKEVREDLAEHGAET